MASESQAQLSPTLSFLTRAIDSRRAASCRIGVEATLPARSTTLVARPRVLSTRQPAAVLECTSRLESSLTRILSPSNDGVDSAGSHAATDRSQPCPPRDLTI